MLFNILCWGSGILLLFGLYILLKIRRIYDEGKPFSKAISLGLWIIDTVHCLLVILSSSYAIWLLPINAIVALICGLIMLGIGAVVMLAGMIEFRSIYRVSGLDTSELVTTGIYRWTRNPQYLGWFLVLTGISMIGRSGLALLLTMIAIILFHIYIIQMEEPYLERIFGKKYITYKAKAPRYIGVPKKKPQKIN